MFFFFNDTATTEIYTLSLHDALPISAVSGSRGVRRLRWQSAAGRARQAPRRRTGQPAWDRCPRTTPRACVRSEEHTSELQSRQYLVCRLLLEKKNFQDEHIKRVRNSQ